MKRADFFKINIFDFILIGLILFFSTGVIFFSKAGLNWQLSEDSEAFVYQEGKLAKRLKLEKHQDFVLNDGKIIIETKQGGIRIKKSDCPRQICVNTGWIKTPGRIIVCVPNKILIEIKSEKPLFLDAVVN
ncbi:MAG: NusG domain II-containing protein [Desulfobacteraceae bacterium]|nr:NusG domain II-containing protein [Desulfobacteraceae bacterium]